MVFRKAKVVYGCGMFCFIVGVFTILWFYLRNENLSTMLLLVIFFLVGFMVVAALTQQQEDKAMQALLDVYQKDCRPDKILPEFARLMRKRYHPQKKQWIAINYSAVLCAAGDWAMAQQVLLGLGTLPKGQAGARYTMVVQNNLFTCCYGLGDIAGAQGYLAAMQATLAALPDKPATKTIGLEFEKRVREKTYMLQMMQGNYSGAKEYLEYTLPLEKLPLSIVSNEYHLGCVYAHLNMTDQARAAYEYTAQHGGTTWYAAAAQARLAQF